MRKFRLYPTELVGYFDVQAFQEGGLRFDRRQAFGEPVIIGGV
jgi:hypothetical protein